MILLFLFWKKEISCFSTFSMKYILLQVIHSYSQLTNLLWRTKLTILSFDNHWNWVFSAQVAISSVGKESTRNAGDLAQSLGWKDPWRRERLPTPVFWPGESHVQSMESQRVDSNWVTFTFTFQPLSVNKLLINRDSNALFPSSLISWAQKKTKEKPLSMLLFK